MAVRIPPFLTRLTVQNFRSLRDIDLPLNALNVLVGANGAGKSNLLDVIDFLGDSVREDLGPAIAKRGGFDRVAFRGPTYRSIDWVSIQIEAAVTRYSSRTALDQYTLEFRARPLRRRRPGSSSMVTDEVNRFLQRKERFLFKRTQGQGRRITINGSDLSVMTGDAVTRQGVLQEGSLGLSTLPRLGPEEGGGSEQVEALASLFASFRIFDVDVLSVWSRHDDMPSSVLASDARNLSGYLSYLKDDHPLLFEQLERDARSFVPGLEKLQFVKAPNGAVAVQILERGLSSPTELEDASFGSVRALALLSLLYDPDPPKLTCIEEIDHGLHPYVLDRLVELLRNASKRTQLLIATHSPALVNRLAASELIICERRDDASSAIPAIDSKSVREMEAEVAGELGLGELWFSGALGGVPEL